MGCHGQPHTHYPFCIGRAQGHDLPPYANILCLPRCPAELHCSLTNKILRDRPRANQITSATATMARMMATNARALHAGARPTLECPLRGVDPVLSGTRPV